MSKNALILLFAIFPVFTFAEEISFIDSAVSNAGRIEIHVSDRQGRILPCCVSLTNELGEGIWGLDAVGKPFTYRHEPRIWISGDTILNVTAGSYRFVISRPYRYRSHHGKLTLQPGQTQSLQVQLRCEVDMPQYGWYGGDAHQHICHGEKEFAVNAETAAAIARAEGADWSSFNGYYSSVPGEYPTIDDVRKVCECVSDEQYLAFVGEEYPKDHLGHMACLAGPVLDWNQELGRNEYSYPSGQHEAFAHFEILRPLIEQGGTTIYTHPVREYGGTKESPANIARELPFDLLTAPDLISSIDWMTDNPNDKNAMNVWSMYLNWGYQIGVCAFTDTCYDRHDARPMNKLTYVYLGKKRLTSENIIHAIQNGHTIGTSGPLLMATIDGAPPGSVFPCSKQKRMLELTAFSQEVDYTNRAGERPRLEQIEIIRNGKRFHIYNFSNKESYEFETGFPIRETEQAWYIVKAFGSGDRQAAISSPFYFHPPDFTPPKPVQATAQGAITDAQTGKKLNAVIDIIDYRKINPKTIQTKSIKDGAYIIQCPATARLRASAKGCKSQTKSIFFDDPTLYKNLILPLNREDMLDPAYYEKIKMALQNIHLDFALEKE